GRGDVEDPVGFVDDALVGDVARGLSGDALPRRAAVGRAVDGVLLVRHADVGEVGHLGPGGTGVGALPETLAAGRAKVEDAVQVRVDGELLTHAAAGH